MKLEDLKPNVVLRGIIPDAAVTVSVVTWFGSEALEITFKDPEGKLGNELLYRHDEPRLELVKVGRPWSFDGDGVCVTVPSSCLEATGQYRAPTRSCSLKLPSRARTRSPMQMKHSFPRNASRWTTPSQC